MANLYYREDLGPEAFQVGADVEVLGDEARHAVRVSRLRIGEETLVGNGSGALGAAEVTSVERDRFTARFTSVEHHDRPTTRLLLVQALAKGDRDERAVEQATEFGVDAIVPWEAARSVSRWSGTGGSEKTAKGVAKWARIAREASKQSLRAHVPEVREPLSVAELQRLAASDEADVVVLHPRSEGSLSALAREILAQKVNEVYLVVGPEGGLSEPEVDALEAAGARVLALGDTVLRTSSAGPAALAVMNVALGRW